MGNPSITILYHIITRTTLNIFKKKYLYYKKTPKLVAKILATKFGFVPDWWDEWIQVMKWWHISNFIFFLILFFSPLNHQSGFLEDMLTLCVGCGTLDDTLVANIGTMIQVLNTLSFSKIKATHLKIWPHVIEIYRCPIFKWCAETIIHDRWL